MPGRVELRPPRHARGVRITVPREGGHECDLLVLENLLVGVKCGADRCQEPSPCVRCARGDDACPGGVYGGLSLSSIYSWTGIRRARSNAVCSAGQTVSESAATVRQAMPGLSNRLSGYRASTCDAKAPYWVSTSDAYCAVVVAVPTRSSCLSVPAMTSTLLACPFASACRSVMVRVLPLIAAPPCPGHHPGSRHQPSSRPWLSKHYADMRRRRRLCQCSQPTAAAKLRPAAKAWLRVGICDLQSCGSSEVGEPTSVLYPPLS